MLTVRDIMTPRLDCVAPETTLVDCARRLVELHVAALPICDHDDRVRGTLSAQAIVVAVAQGTDPSTTTAVEIEAAVRVLRGDESIEAALSIMKKQRIGTLPVVDGARLIGIVSQADIAKTLHVMNDSGAHVARSPVSKRDVMFEGGLPAYLATSASAVRCIKLALLSAGKQTVNSILDFPSGHGRVLRLLKEEFPGAKLAACDLDADAVDFCARAFDARAFLSAEDPSQVEIEGEFDLIWCGSLLTHLDAPRWRGFIELFHGLLSADGVLVFTTHGRQVAARLANGESYGLADERVADVLARYERDGFGYADYPGQQDYGISVSSSAWVCALLNAMPLRLVSYTEQAWVGAHDVVACDRLD